MSQEITNAMLVRVATDSALKYMGRLGMEYKSSAFTGYLDATRTALEVERESLRILKKIRTQFPDTGQGYLLEIEMDNHIQVLRTRLGINPE